MNLQYLTKSIDLLPVCSELAIPWGGGGYRSRVNCFSILSNRGINITGKAISFSAYLKRFPP